MTGGELKNISKAHMNGILAGDGPFTKECQFWLQNNLKTQKSLLTHSCTAALEMAALLLDIVPGDEIIMPSYTFVSTANSFVLRGGIPVFVDIRNDTLNIDENLIESAITKKTKAIVPVHYAGVSCEMDAITQIADRHKLAVVEDAAQGIMSTYKSKPLGSIGTFGALSFHETKNIISGEGGALLINNSDYSIRAEIVREKGTNRSQYFRGEIDKYTWQDSGSSYLPGEVTAAFLSAQFVKAKEITELRINIWNEYHKILEELEKRELIRRPTVPSNCKHNAHMYYVILADNIDREKVIDYMNSREVSALFHYVPLHTSPGGRKFCKNLTILSNTDRIANQLLRLPIWIGLGQKEQEYVLQVLIEGIKAGKRT